MELRYKNEKEKTPTRTSVVTTIHTSIEREKFALKLVDFMTFEQIEKKFLETAVYIIRPAKQYNH